VKNILSELRRLASRTSESILLDDFGINPASQSTHYHLSGLWGRRTPSQCGRLVASASASQSTHYHLSGLWGRRTPSQCCRLVASASRCPISFVLRLALRRLAGRTSLLVDSLIDGFFLVLLDAFFVLSFF
jgi:hypothetical protein